LEKDRLLMWIAIIIGFINFAANILAVIFVGIEGAVLVFLASTIALYIIKNRAVKTYFKKYEWIN